MNQLEIFKATISHEPHNQYLFYADFTPHADKKIREALNISKNTNLREYFGMYTPVEVNLKPPLNLKPKNFAKYFSDIEIPENAFINSLGVLEIPGSMFHFTKYISPLRNAATLKEIEDFPFPDVEGYTDEHMKETVDNAHKNNLAASCGLIHMYEDSWQIRGYTQFLVDMIENPNICEFILDKIMERNLRKAIAGAKAGVDLLITGDDVANQRGLMFSPVMWRHFIKSRWEKVYSAAKQIKPDIQIWYHSDGNIESIIPELIEIGVTILNPVQPECLDPITIKEKYGKKLVLDGTIGTQSTMPFGTVEEVRKTVRDRKRDLGYDGALMLSPTHILEPEVPVENILAFIETCKEDML